MKAKIYFFFFCCVLFFLPADKCLAQIGTLVDSFTYSGGSFQGLGIAYDGNGFWISGSSNWQIYKYDSTGSLLDSISDPAANVFDFTEGMIYNGNHLYTTCYTCDTLYQLDVAAHQVTGGFVGMTPDERVSIAYDGNNKFYFANGSDGTGAFTFDIASGTFTPWNETATARGLVYMNNNVYGTDRILFPSPTSRIFTLDTLTGNASNYQTWCVNDVFGGVGMAWDGHYLWQLKYGESKVYKIQVSYPVFSGTVYVTPAGAGSKDGSSWSNALDSLGLITALNSAVPGTEFWVAAGTYKPTYGTLQTSTFNIHDSIKVYGGFAGTETQLGQRDFTVNVTIFDGSLGNPSDTDNVNRIITFDHVGDQTRLDGITLQNAYNNNPSGYPAARGGAIYIDGTNGGICEPIIENCVIQNNQSTSGAGCYSNAGGNGEVAEHFINCLFRNNVSYISYGGAYRAARLGGGNIRSVFENCTFDQNVASSSIYSLRGGAIYLGTSNESLGVINSQVLQCTFTQNSAYLGGAVAIEENSILGDSLLIANCAFYYNTSGAGGNAFFETRTDAGISSIDISSCIFKANSQDTSGGFVQGTIYMGVSGGEVNLVLDNCLISGNSASEGAGLSLNAALGPLHATITNTTIAGNLSSLLGGGISIMHFNPGYLVDLNVSNSILWGNSSSIEQDTGFFSSSPVYNLSNSIIEGGFTGTNIMDTDPGFVNQIPFSNAPDTTGDYQLQVTSPAINSGDNNTVISAVDLLGNIRIYGGSVDMGCYEFGSVPLGDPTITQKQLNLPVFPNPVTKIFSLATEPGFAGSVLIQDESGRDVFRKKYLHGQYIDVSMINPGIYFVTLFSEHAVPSGNAKILILN